MEPFSIAASAAGLVSLTKDLFDTGRELKHFIDSAKNAPKTLESLSVELKLLAGLLNEIKDYEQLPDTNALLETAIQQAQESLKNVKTITEGLQTRLRAWRLGGRLAISFKERDVSDMLRDLERAKSSVSIAQSIYMKRLFQAKFNCAALQAAREQEMASQTSELVRMTYQLLQDKPSRQNSIISSASIRNDMAPENLTRSTRQQQRKHPSYSTTIPLWMLGRTCRLAVSSARGNWTINIWIWNGVPYQSAAFQCCRQGDVTALKALFASGQASPRDYWTAPGGLSITLLEMATLCGHVEVCTLLLDCGGIPDDEIVAKSLNLFADNPHIWHWNQEAASAILRLFFEQIGVDYDWRTLYPSGHSLGLPRVCFPCPDSDTFKMVLKNWTGEHAKRDRGPSDLLLEEPGGLASNDPVAPLVIFEHFGVVWENECLKELSQGVKDWLLHTLAEIASLYSVRAPSRYSEFLNLAKDIIQAGANVSSLINERTPLLRFCLPFTRWYECPLSFRLKSIRFWATILEKTGIDLSSYGEGERKIWTDLNVSQIDATPSLPDTKTCIRLHDLVYGLGPEEWDIVIKRVVNVTQNEWACPPGTWSVPVTSTICWTPTSADGDEQYWKAKPSFEISSDPILAREGQFDPDWRIEMSQKLPHDDSSPVWRMIDAHGKHQYRPRKRSSSQPRSLRGANMSYFAAQPAFRSSRRVLFHRCPLDMQLRLHEADFSWHESYARWGDLGFIAEDFWMDRPQFDLRRCMSCDRASIPDPCYSAWQDLVSTQRKCTT